MKRHNACIASIPSKRNDPYAAAATGVDNPGFLLTTAEKFTDLAQTYSIWPVIMGLACCTIEMVATSTPRFDMAHFGWEVFCASPRHADVMIVSSHVFYKMTPIVRSIHDSMPEPKWVISMGAYASSEGIFNNYAAIQGYGHVVPVGIYLPGCPPRPEMPLNTMLEFTRQIEKKPLLKHREEVAYAVKAVTLLATPTYGMKGLLA